MKNPFKSPTSWILLGIPFLWIMGFVFHSIYDYSGNIIIIGVFCPVNESVWEHLKLVLYPTLIWFGIGYLILSKKSIISGTKWTICTTISIIISSMFIIAFYYSYTGALGIESMVLDILSLILGVLLSQCISLHFYKYGKENDITLYICIILLGLLVFIFSYFTFYPPKLPIFMDSSNGKYGI